MLLFLFPNVCLHCVGSAIMCEIQLILWIVLIDNLNILFKVQIVRSQPQYFTSTEAVNKMKYHSKQTIKLIFNYFIETSLIIQSTKGSDSIFTLYRSFPVFGLLYVHLVNEMTNHSYNTRQSHVHRILHNCICILEFTRCNTCPFE